MFGIGMTELLVIMAVALVVFGPKRLPELARSMGRALGEFRQASSDLRQSLSETPPPQPPEGSDPAPGDATPSALPNPESDDDDDLPDSNADHTDAIERETVPPRSDPTA